MQNVKNFIVLVAVCTLFSCSISAKTDVSADSSKQKTTEESVTKSQIIHITKADFLSKIFNYEENPTQWMYKGERPCIVDFYADWCGPCRAIAPILEELANQYQDEIIIYKVNVDKEKELAGVFGVQSIPTILFIPKEGKPMLAQGALPKEEFIKQIEGFLLKK